MIKTKLGYFWPVTSPTGLKELRWQQTPFCEPLSQENENVSHETLEQLHKYLSGRLTHFSIPIDFSHWSSAMTRWFNSIESSFMQRLSIFSVPRITAYHPNNER